MKIFFGLVLYLCLLAACKKKSHQPVEISPEPQTTAVIASESTGEQLIQADSQIVSAAQPVTAQQSAVPGVSHEKLANGGVGPKKPALETDANAGNESTTNEIKTPDIAPKHAVPDHQLWNTLLQKYVSRNGQVNYRALKNQRVEFDQYLQILQDNPPDASWSREEQLTYWTNTYNAFTVDLILRHYPLKSIMDLKSPWDQKFIRLGSKMYSLNQIEHEIVRPQFKEPRIHFAFVCAAVSCPKLLNEAYQAQRLEQQLERQTRYFLNESGKNIITRDRAQISMLFSWYGDDFKAHGGLIEFLNQYLEQPISPNAKIEFLEYDWSLNE